MVGPRRASGFTIIELLVSSAIVLVLLTAICLAVIQMLKVEAVHAGRASMGRTVSQLATRMQEEARSSTAVFIPSVDILGQANDAAAAHEVDLYRKLSAGGSAYVAYRYDATAKTVMRYDYTGALGNPTIQSTDTVATDVSSFVAHRQAVSSSDLIAGSDTPKVSILYGSSQVVGGNDIVVIDVSSQSGVSPIETVAVHLAAGAYPTSLAVLAAGIPPTTPPTHTVPFALLRPGFQVHFPHGPHAIGSPGDPNDTIHWVAATGSAQFIGPGPELSGSWLELSSLYTRITTGVYVFHNSSGAQATVTVSCGDIQCPYFAPTPVLGGPFTPRNGVAFQTLN